MEIRERYENHQGAYYPYQPIEMSQIDFNDPWNVKYTIDDREEFNRRVLVASHFKPVLVKFGLIYCIHCMLLENIGAMPAVAEKYGHVMNVYKLWWNPKNPHMRVLNNLAREEGVEDSPYFILYINGRAVRAGYAFPDENGEGMESF